MQKILIKILLLLIFTSTGFGQKVGLVLSGGGAKGLAHIGLLKALEENNIPVDYIVGTSMGAIVGGLYAAGYSPQEIEKIATSQKFLDWAYGRIPGKYFYYIKKHKQTPAWLELNFKYDSIIKPYLPISFINTSPMNFAFMELFSQAGQAANNNFDSLFVPFRCITSDIINNKPITLEKGDLGLAIRASMAYPVYYSPVVVNNKILYDGGIYNNFAVDVMENTFNPDIIIGNKTYTDKKIIDNDDLLKLVEKLVFNNNNAYDTLHNLFVMQPPGLQNYAVFEFNKAREIIDLGYKYALTQIDTIKKIINIYRDSAEVQTKREKFRAKEKPLLFKDIKIMNLNKQQKKYIYNNFKKRKDSVLTLTQVKKGYYKILQDKQFSQLLPLAKFDKNTGLFTLKLNVKPEKHFTARLGGNITTGAFTTGYLELVHRILTSKSYTFMLNGYFGKFYNSAGFSSHIEIPGRSIYYFNFGINYNRFNYFTSNTEWFFLENNPSFIIRYSLHSFAQMAIALDTKTKFSANVNLNNDVNTYYQTFYFSIDDTADVTYFPHTKTYFEIDKNTLDYPQYPTKGTKTSFKIGYIWGLENYKAGSTSSRKYYTYRITRHWPYIHFLYKKVIITGKFLITPSVEAYFSNQPEFENYYASSLYFKQFTPTPYSKTLFLHDFRASSWVGSGISFDYNIYKGIYLHVNPNVFLPETKHLEKNDEEVLLEPLSYYNILLETSLIYHTKFGPVSLSFNILDKTFRKQSILLNFGYIIFNNE